MLHIFYSFVRPFFKDKNSYINIFKDPQNINFNNLETTRSNLDLNRYSKLKKNSICLLASIETYRKICGSRLEREVDIDSGLRILLKWYKKSKYLVKNMVVNYNYLKIPKIRI